MYQHFLLKIVFSDFSHGFIVPVSFYFGFYLCLTFLLLSGNVISKGNASG
ncbi:Uncharacterised protein [Kluyvera cryocrescens]|uniref:Uncharacterized protein n=1 Tax=Kluyvera cryocrescens TaxID=580 RepID=A0A485ALT2_KLUCR|nr:Uncharacterised protein [Kluyvera cryocrescens]